MKKSTRTCLNVMVALGAAICVQGNCAYAKDIPTNTALVRRIHADIHSLRYVLFDIKKVEKASGVKLQIYKQGSITEEKIFRPLGKLRWPYSDIEYELRSNGAWAGVVLAINPKYCISPDDLNDFFPLGEGVPETSDHFPDDDLALEFGSAHNKVTVVYRSGLHSKCARQFMIEAAK